MPISSLVDTFLDNAARIFDVACTGHEEFALVIGQDGGLHFFMESPDSPYARSAYAGAANAYRVTRSARGVRVEGKSFGRDCVLQQNNVRETLLRDQVLYLTPMTSGAMIEIQDKKGPDSLAQADQKGGLRAHCAAPSGVRAGLYRQY